MVSLQQTNTEMNPCPPPGVQMDRSDGEDNGSHCCLVAIGRLQVTNTPNCSDLMGPNATTEFISRHSVDGKFTFVDQRSVAVKSCFFFFLNSCMKSTVANICVEKDDGWMYYLIVGRRS